MCRNKKNQKATKVAHNKVSSFFLFFFFFLILIFKGSISFHHMCVLQQRQLGRCRSSRQEGKFFVLLFVFHFFHQLCMCVVAKVVRETQRQ